MSRKFMSVRTFEYVFCEECFRLRRDEVNHKPPKLSIEDQLTIDGEKSRKQGRTRVRIDDQEFTITDADRLAFRNRKRKKLLIDGKKMWEEPQWEDYKKPPPPEFEFFWVLEKRP